MPAFFTENVGTDIDVLMNVTLLNGLPLTQATTGSVIRSLTLPDGTTSTTTLVTASVVFNAPQNDSGWSTPPGYNFKDTFRLTQVGSYFASYTFLDTSGKQVIDYAYGTSNPLPTVGC
jgi:hypothetical protein